MKDLNKELLKNVVDVLWDKVDRQLIRAVYSTIPSEIVQEVYSGIESPVMDTIDTKFDNRIKIK